MPGATGRSPALGARVRSCRPGRQKFAGKRGYFAISWKQKPGRLHRQEGRWVSLAELRGRPRKFQTPKALRKAVDAYFDAISYERDAVEKIDSGEKDADGHTIWKTVPITAKNGQVAKVLYWTQPPGICDLCLQLRIDRSTWARMEKQPGYAEVCAYARDRIEAYLAQRLDGKNTQGVIFNLTHNFGWKERRELSLDEHAAKAIGAAGMSMQEKQALLQQLLQGAERNETEGRGA